MSYFKRIFNNCSEVSKLSLQDKEQPVSLGTRVEMYLHVAFCKCCKNFIKQSHKIDTAMEKMSSSLTEAPPMQKASEEFKSKLKERLKEV